MKTLYLRIYATVVAVLLVFALVAGVVLRNVAENERVRIESAMAQRVAAWGALIESSLPSAGASDELQRDALLDWSERLRLPLALESADGRRIATSPGFARREDAVGGLPARAVKVPMADGRALWLVRPGARFALAQRDSPPGRDLEAPTRARGEFPNGPWWRAESQEERGRRLGLPPGPRLSTPAAGPAAEPGDPPAPAWNGLPPWLPPWLRPWGEGGLLAVLGVLFLAIAGGSYPVVRRLTRRLEGLKSGVEIFGAGHLEHRVDETGRDEVAAVARSFNLAARRIEELVRSNRSLLANASHELRSPLARLKMALAMLDGAGETQRAALKEEIERDIRELDALVEEVLLASRLDAQSELQREQVDLLGVLAEEAARVGCEAEGSDLQVAGDERLLRRALRNLLENARRHGGGEVEARLERRGNDAVVCVSDRGPGVPEAERERIFEPFYRLAGHGEHAGGVGLGLSLVRQIAERHGGRVHCEGREGGGSRFLLTLPLGGARG